MRGREKFKKIKLIINIIAKFYSLFPKKVQNRMFIKLRKKTGSFAMLKRYCIIKNLAKNIGDNVSIHPDVYIYNIQNLSIGDNVSIHPMTYIEACGYVEIGNDVSIAEGVTIMSVNHQFSNLEIPIKDQPVLCGKITIEDNVWLGAKSTILYGRTIKKGSIVGANCLVTKDVQENEIVGGVPNRLIKKRTDN